MTNFDRGEWETRAAERNAANWDDYAAGTAYDAPRAEEKRCLTLATVGTAHYDLTVIAESVGAANVALLTRWAEHVEHSGANPDLMRHLIERGDVNYYQAALGEVIFE